MDKVLDFSKKLIIEKNEVNHINLAIDATLGNGYDTLFLKDISNEVLSFDIQEKAVKNFINNYKFTNVRVINDSHEEIEKYLNNSLIDICMFNLGYLPNSDKTITTKKDSTLNALKVVLKNLNKNGLVTIIVYPGHYEGNIEKEYLLEYLKTLNQKEFECLKYEFINQVNNPPFLLAIKKIDTIQKKD